MTTRSNTAHRRCWRWRWRPARGGGCGSSERRRLRRHAPRLRDAPWPARRRRWPPCTSRPTSCCRAAPTPTKKRIAALRGYPVVANVWASWCGPCRFEFPILQKLSARYGKRVAFLGVNSEDSDDAAKTFLAEAPVPYPSYTDPDKEIADSLGAAVGLPDTAFYDRAGKLVYLKQGPYADDSELEADVRRYALKGG